MSNVKCHKSNVKCQMPNFNKVKLLSERSCGAPAVIFKRVQGVNIVKSVEYVKSAECVKYAKITNSASIV